MARTTTTRKAPKATRKTKTPAKTTKAKGYAAKLEQNWVDTKGEALDEPVTTDIARQAKIDKANLERIEKAKTREYQGAPIPATRVLVRDMPEFKNTSAECVLFIDTTNNTYGFANTYRGGILPASYDVSHYRWVLTEKAQRKLDKKIEAQGFRELEPSEWYPWLVMAEKPAAVKRSPSPRSRKGK